MSEYTTEQLGEMVGKTFNGGQLTEVMGNGNLVVKVGNSFTQVRRKEIQTLMTRSNIVNTQPELSDEVRQTIREEKYGARPTADERPTLKQQRDINDAKHREMVAKKYNVE